MAGRKTKLTPAVQEKIIQALLGGNYFNTACRYAGISEATGYEWLDRGESDNPRRGKADIYVKFAEAIRETEAQVEVRRAAQWQTRMPEDWRAIQMFMERRYPDVWGRRERQEHVGPGGGPVAVTFTDLLKQAAEEDGEDGV